MIRRLLSLLAVVPLPAMAAGFVPPEGCAVQMTVQSKQCRVSNYYTCSAEPEGTMWRMDADRSGPFFLTQTSDEGEWLQSFDGNGRQVLGKAADRASIRTLYAEGRDTYDFWLEHEGRDPTRVTGHDALTGRSVTIDGQQLEETEFAFTEATRDGIVLRQSRGNEFVSREFRSFFAGPSEHSDGAGEWLPSDGRPMTFAFPGEKGFRATQPIFDCDAITS